MSKQWIVVADASQARVLEVRGSELVVLREFDNPAGRARNQDLVSEESGRMNKSGRRIRSAMDPATSPHDQQAILFAHRLAKLLDSGATEGGYDRLMLVAPPHLLGLLREAISPAVQHRVCGELSKDFAHADLESLKKLLADRLEFSKARG